jgi:glucose-6-phosphate-specific signal transduction histidine kinase
VAKIDLPIVLTSNIEETITWRGKLIARCLILVAIMFTTDPELRDELKKLNTAIYLIREKT